MKKVLVIAGLTASGKTALSLEWAKQFNGEIINGDSQQVYKGLNIGTAKIKEEEKQGIPHHLLDICDINENFHVKAFQSLCRAKIDEIIDRAHLPILVGGTGLYLKAALYDYEFSEDHFEQDDFEGIENEELYQWLLELDPKSCETIHVNNRKRIVRALHIAKSGKTKTERIEAQAQKELYDVMWIVLAPAKESLDQRIKQRVDIMFNEGLQKEVEHYFSEPNTRNYQSFQAIGYREWAGYFESDVNLDTIKEKIVIHTRQFAKRQKTWFKHQIPGLFVDSLNEQEVMNAYLKVKEWCEK